MAATRSHADRLARSAGRVSLRGRIGALSRVNQLAQVDRAQRRARPLRARIRETINNQAPTMELVKLCPPMGFVALVTAANLNCLFIAPRAQARCLALATHRAHRPRPPHLAASAAPRNPGRPQAARSAQVDAAGPCGARSRSCVHFRPGRRPIIGARGARLSGSALRVLVAQGARLPCACNNHDTLRPQCLTGRVGAID